MIVYKKMIIIILSVYFMRQTDGLREAEVMLTDNISVRDNGIILFDETVA